MGGGAVRGDLRRRGGTSRAGGLPAFTCKIIKAGGTSRVGGLPAWWDLLCPRYNLYDSKSSAFTFLGLRQKMSDINYVFRVG